MITMTIAEIDEEIKTQKKLSEKLQEDNLHKQCVSDMHEREVVRLRCLRFFTEKFGHEDIKYGGGLILVKDKVEISARTLKWRNRGEGKWYRSANKHWERIYTSLYEGKYTP